MTDSLSPPPEGTRAALLDAALHLFGRKGFDATSIRDIAGRARANVAAIAYHFGGKDGLRAACGAEFARRIRAVVAPLMTVEPLPPDAAEARLEALLRRVLGFLTGAPQAQDMVAFMLREVAVEGPVFGAIYAGLIEPLHGHFCDLWSQATGQDAASEYTRLRVFSLLGQVIYFRIGRPIVCRRMGWQTIGEDEADRLAEVLAANLHALIELDRRK